ncbi:unnamed protein product [Pieris brassicae]|uniref:Uncharacterized protein n=1 Tax=Pieris brassicae TaxID=7116 RepID=A0A9P0TG95_PIEBR|nr:unnamed protein product [Pieris brassicae]
MQPPHAPRYRMCICWESARPRSIRAEARTELPSHHFSSAPETVESELIESATFPNFASINILWDSTALFTRPS